MTDTMATTMVEQTVGRYFDMWNETDGRLGEVTGFIAAVTLRVQSR
jgi:hypothetical protein